MAKSASTTPALPDQLVTRRMLRKLVPVSDEAIRRWLKRGAFPRPLLINGRNFWRLSELTYWLQRQSPRASSAPADEAVRAA